MGTSSMLRTFTSGGVMPWGQRSALPYILLASRVMAFSMVRAHLEAGRAHGEAREAGAVDVLDVLDLPDLLLHGPGDDVLHLGRGRAGQHHHHVDHGHDDLGLLLARRQAQGEQAQQQRGDDQQRRDLRVDEDLREPGRAAPAGLVLRGESVITSSPPCRPRPAARPRHTTTVSPPDRPERISMRSPWLRPRRTQRRAAVPSSATVQTPVSWPRSITAAAGTMTASRLPTGMRDPGEHAALEAAVGVVQVGLDVVGAAARVGHGHHARDGGACRRRRAAR